MEADNWASAIVDTRNCDFLEVMLDLCNDSRIDLLIDSSDRQEQLSHVEELLGLFDADVCQTEHFSFELSGKTLIVYKGDSDETGGFV